MRDYIKVSHDLSMFFKSFKVSWDFIKEMSISMKCLFLWNVYFVEMSISLKCLFLCNVYFYEMSISMKCLFLWNVYLYKISILMKCSGKGVS